MIVVGGWGVLDLGAGFGNLSGAGLPCLESLMMSTIERESCSGFEGLAVRLF